MRDYILLELTTTGRSFGNRWVWIFSDAVTGGVLLKKMFLKISQN